MSEPPVLRPLPGSGFEPTMIGWEGPEETPGLICSYCGETLPDDEDHDAPIPLIIWDDRGWTARFCAACQLRYFGLTQFEMPDD
jgi:hypothetical protein